MMITVIKKIRILIIGFLYFTLLSACGGGNGDGLDINGDPLDPGNSRLPLAASLSSIQENVFSINCALPGCHIPATAPFGLSLDTVQNSAEFLIGVDSAELSTFKRIKAFDPDNSYLIQKIEGTSGNRMPLNRPPLSPEVIDVIRQWITDGAAIN